ncbi:MAG: hypothetical protein JWO32_2454 [Bacteroidetes bacterium]|nr:hypothetical protein [Bacteroidota bacterium]
MIVFITYTLFFAWFIYKNAFFGLFNDGHLTKKNLLFVFILKVLAVPAFYLLFKFSYGGITKLDAGKFYSDSVIMNNLAYIDVKEYLKMLFGFQDDSQGSFFFNTCINLTDNWDNGQVKDFLYNDNRVVIRLHSLIHFIAFGSYFVHALFSCFLSYAGMFFLYKCFKEFFNGKELLLFICISLFPTLWLYTGGLLKEGITMFVLGTLLYNLKIIISGRRTSKLVIILFLLLFVSLLLKPYILFYGAVVFALFFILHKSQFKFKSIILLGSLLLIILLINFTTVIFKKRSLLQAVQKREMEFKDLSTGGIFLLDSSKFVRLAYDTNLVNKIKTKPNHYSIKKNVPYTYWEHTHQQDTLQCAANNDTATIYSLVYILPKAGSAIDVVKGSHNLFVITLRSLYFTTLHPLFFNAKGLMQQFASLENVLLAAALLIILIVLCLGKQEKFAGFTFLFFGLSLFVLIGFTTPNSGAIMRYRAPGAIFIIMSALYFFDAFKHIFKKIIN